MVATGYRHCFESASSAAGRPLSEDELLDLFERAQSRMERLVRSGMSAKDAAMEAGRQLGVEHRRAAIIEERSQKINLAARHSLLSRVRDGDEFTSLEGVLAGEQRGNERGVSLSVNSRVREAEARHHGALATSLRAGGLLKASRSMRGELEDRVAQDMAHLNNPAKFKASGDRTALDIAKAYYESLEAVRAEQNAAGAWIGKQDLYVARQSHDMMKVRGKGPTGDFATWRNAIMPLLDERTFDGRPANMSEDEYLHSIWQALSSGVHDSANGSDWLTGFRGSANAAKRASQERTIHFKGPDEWMAYNRQFGTGSLHEAVLKSVRLGARNAAVMRELGTNPEAMLDHVLAKSVDQAKKRDDFPMVDRLQKLKDHALLDTITGKSAPITNWKVARIASNVRALESLTKLGGVVLSSLPDVAVRASALRANGVPLLESYWRTVSDILPGPGARYRRRMAQSMGIGVQGMLGEMATRFAMADGTTGVMHRAVNWLHKLNGLTYWTDSLRAGAAMMLTNHLGDAAASEFEKMHPRMRDGLTRYGIQAPEWDVIRQAAQRGADGSMYLMPDDIRALGDAASDELANRYAAYVGDVADDAMSEPEIRTTSRMQASYRAMDGVSPWLGQALRAVMQFKTYPLSFIRRSWDREVKRNGPDVPGLVHLMVGTTVLGYAAMSAKQLVAGLNPRDPSDPKTWLAAMQQGGGLGIYGDFLFGQNSRMGNSFLETLAGPTLGDVGNIMRVYSSTRDELSHEPGAPGSGSYLQNLAATARGFVPGGNLFYAKLAIDHLFYNQMLEGMNPGYMARHQANVLRNSGQTYWLNPAWSPYQSLGITQ